jgi:hypothetical protein
MYSILESKSQKRLDDWFEFRKQLEFESDPFQKVYEYFKSKPKVKFYTDPYDQDTWPDPWELINENEFCPFNLVLGMCYTLQLVESFQDKEFKISISVDDSNKIVYYLLFVEDKVYGYEEDSWISAQELPTTLRSIKIYTMLPLY